MQKLAILSLFCLFSLLLGACGAGSGTPGSGTTNAATPGSTPDASMCYDVYSCIPPSPPAGGNISCSPSGFTLEVETFCAGAVSLTKGSTLTFMNDPASGTPHYLVIGRNGTAESEQGAPDFGASPRIISPGQSFTTGAWNTAGVFHVTCQIHPTTMNLTITVTG